MVRPRSATPLSAGSNPAVTSKTKMHPIGCIFVLELPTIDLNRSSLLGGSNLKTRRKRLSIVFAEVFCHKARSVPSRVHRGDGRRLCDWCGPSPPTHVDPKDANLLAFCFGGADQLFCLSRLSAHFARKTIKNPIFDLIL